MKKITVDLSNDIAEALDEVTQGLCCKDTNELLERFIICGLKSHHAARLAKLSRRIG